MFLYAPIDPPAIVEAVHEWYSPTCCGGHDCGPVDGVRILPGGYGLPDGEVIGYTSPAIKQSQDERFHWCRITYPNTSFKTTRCLYVPPFGN